MSPYFHLAAYSGSIAGTANTDVNAVADEVFTIRNNHLIFTQPVNLLAALPIGALLSRARFNSAQLTQLGNNHLWPITVSATIPDLPQPQDMRESPMELPQNEELTVEVTNTGAGPTQTSALLWLAAPEWNQNYPVYVRRLRTRATVVAAAGSETTWNALASLSFEKNLLNGVYSVIGAAVVAADALAFRFRFPDAQTIRGRQFRPGGMVQNATNLYPWQPQFGGFGEWGRFHTFTPPEVQILGDAAGGTYEVRLDLLYLGTDESLLAA